MDPLPPPLPPPLPTEAMEPPAPVAPRIAQVANPTPVHLPTHNHPSYAEMITAAITALKERNGSSRQAIAKYIERVYSDLPPTHSSLLTQHLKRLKNSGQLVMFKHSYKLPRSPTQSQPEPAGNAAASTPGPKRKPGRPPKPKPEAHLQPDTQPPFQPQPQFQPPPQFQLQPQFQFQPESMNQFQLQHPTQLQFHQQALPQFQVQPFVVPEAQNSAGIGPESVFASLGLVDAPAGPPSQAPPPPAADAPVTKRRPGRPKRIDSEGKGPPRPLGVRRPGRPPKVGVTAESGVVGSPRGRPKRNTSTGTGKPRGRPKANAATIAKKLGRPRGRPAKNAQLGGAGGLVINVPITDSDAASAPLAGNAPVAGSGAGASNGVVPTPKRRGRPPRLTQPTALNTADGVLLAPKPRGRAPRSDADGDKKPRKLSGKPLGRPRKSVPLVAPNAPDSQQLAALQDLQGKLEQLKSRIKETASVIRPCLNSETAMAALQDLEAFAANGVNPIQPI